MEIKENKIYEIEKIITRRFHRNKKYYLIKWLCYPIGESTWEPKSSLKHLNFLLRKFENEYPLSIDKEMYSIYCNEITRKKKSKKNKEKIKLLNKKRKIEFFSETELKDIYYDKLKLHLHINVSKRTDIKNENDLIIDLSSNKTSFSDENIFNFPEDKESTNEGEEVNEKNQLIMPIME